MKTIIHDPLAQEALLTCLEHLSAAFGAMDGAVGHLDGVWQAAGLDSRDELSRLIRRTANMALMAGAKPDSVNEARRVTGESG